MFAAITHWSSMRPLAFATLSILEPYRTPPGYPVVALCHGDPAALEQQDWTFHVSQPFFSDIDFGVGHLRAVNLDLGGSRAGQTVLTPSPPYPHH